MTPHAPGERAPMKRLAIISSYNESCGNASYTHVLMKAFSEHVKVDVLPLDLFLLQKTGSKFREHADRHIKQIAARLKDYDYVNIQFEAGLYGSTIRDIYRRIAILIGASPNLIVTMHRIDPLASTRWNLVTEALQRRSVGYYFESRERLAYARLYFKIVQLVKKLSRSKNAWIAVHTRRERRLVQEVYGLANCFDYPLTYLQEAERAKVLDESNRKAFLQKHSIDEGTKVVGTFGYISAYKGFKTAVSALRYLPDNYVLVIFGSQHPQTIRMQTEIDEYLQKLIDFIDEESSNHVKRRVARARKLKARGMPPEEVSQLIRYNLLDRVRFVGSLPDSDFIEALRCCDAAVLPYLEVGQSMSGVIALAMESGAKMICSNNLGFFEVRKYYGDAYTTFDIGNAVELAQKIVAGPSDFREVRDAVVKKYNIRNSIAEHLDRFGFRSSSVSVQQVVSESRVKERVASG